MKNSLTLIALILVLSFAATPNARSQWVETNGPSTLIDALAISGSVIFAGGTQEEGVNGCIFRSTDSGTTWTSASSGIVEPEDAHVTSFAVMGTNIFSGFREGTDPYLVYQWSDEEQNWVSASNDLPTSISVNAFGVSGTNLFLETTKSGLYRSTDSGGSWVAVDSGLPEAGLPQWHNTYSFAASGNNIFVGTDSGVYVSGNNGASWTPYGLETYQVDGLGVKNPVHVTGLAVIGTTLFAGTDGYGVFSSSDSGATWVNTNIPSNASSVTFAVSGTKLFAYAGAIFLTTNNGTSWEEIDSQLTVNANNNLVYQINAFAVSGNEIYIDAVNPILDGDRDSVWRQPLSDFGIAAVVPQSTSIENSLTSYPNPFSSSTTISFTSPESGVVEVTIMNLLGEEVARIFSGELQSGGHSFSWDASGMPPGMYECLVRNNGRVERIAMVLAR